MTMRVYFVLLNDLILTRVMFISFGSTTCVILQCHNLTTNNSNSQLAIKRFCCHFLRYIVALVQIIAYGLFVVELIRGWLKTP